MSPGTAGRAVKLLFSLRRGERSGQEDKSSQVLMKRATEEEKAGWLRMQDGSWEARGDGARRRRGRGGPLAGRAAGPGGRRCLRSGSGRRGGAAPPRALLRLWAARRLLRRGSAQPASLAAVLLPLRAVLAPAPPPPRARPAPSSAPPSPRPRPPPASEKLRCAAAASQREGKSPAGGW